MNRLILMAGSTRREGWKTLDCKGSVDYLATVPPLPDAVKAIRWDEIELIHGISQLYPWDAETLLREIRGVMTPGGLLVLEQPNFNALLLRPSRPVEWFFGDPTFKDPSHMVRWAYEPATLSELLSKCGFHNQELLPAQYHVPDRDFRIEARV